MLILRYDRSIFVLESWSTHWRAFWQVMRFMRNVRKELLDHKLNHAGTRQRRSLAATVVIVCGKIGSNFFWHYAHFKTESTTEARSYPQSLQPAVVHSQIGRNGNRALLHLENTDECPRQFTAHNARSSLCRHHVQTSLDCLDSHASRGSFARCSRVCTHQPKWYVGTSRWLV